jgi:hypothetical protein
MIVSLGFLRKYEPRAMKDEFIQYTSNIVDYGKNYKV